MTAAKMPFSTAAQRRIAIERDFQRDLWCVMGLPFDATTEEETYCYLLNCIETRQRCFLTTPNLNFVVAAKSDPAFQKTVIDSDWVIADGMPIIWAAKALGIPLTERVAGSSVFDRLRDEYREYDRPLRIVFFGGPDGVAAEAFKKIATDDSAMEVVGFYSPGFGTIEQMSPQHVIDQINESEPDIVLIALGAKRGQQWISFNQHRINAPIISHLGAVVNFVAGTVARAPAWMQKTGLEWIWRIWEERSLFERYWLDGRTFLKLYLTHIRPYAKLVAQWKKMEIATAATAKLDLHDGILTLTLHGDCTEKTLHSLRQTFMRAILEEKDLIIDFADAGMIDSALIARLILVKKHLATSQATVKLANYSREHRKILCFNGVDGLFNLT